MIRTTRWLPAAAVLALVLASCSGQEPGDGVTGGDGDGPGIRVAVVTAGAENGRASHRGIIGAADTLTGVAELSVTADTPDPADAAAVIRGYADEGYDLIVAHGSHYGARVQEIAVDHPETAFAWGTATDTFGLDNVSSYTAASDEGGYVLGSLAASMCSRIGVVGQVESRDGMRFVEGFKLGAEAGGARVDVTTADIADDGLGAEAATTLVRAGADCLAGTDEVAAGAITVAEREKMPWFGDQLDRTETSGTAAMAGQIYDWDIVLQGLVDDVAEGGLGGNIYGIDLDNGGLVIDLGTMETTDEITRLVEDTSRLVVDREVATRPLG